MYLLSLISRELCEGHSHRLSRVSAAVSTCYYLVAQTGYEPRLKLRFTLLELSEKEGNMSFGIRVNIATAAMEDIYEGYL